MQTHDALHRADGGTVVADLATAFDITPAAAEAAVLATMAELAWYLERNTLSREGLADVVESLGSDDHAKHLDKPGAFRDPAARAGGEAVLGHILGPRRRGLVLAARVARRSEVSEDTIRSMLPVLAVVAMVKMESRGRGPLGEILAVMPPLGRWSRGSPHADLADILRRRCGGGPYAPVKLRRVVRRAVAQAAGFPARGAMRWYVHFILIRRAIVPARRIAARTFGSRAR
jgi:hypothetical protein